MIYEQQKSKSIERRQLKEWLQIQNIISLGVNK